MEIRAQRERGKLQVHFGILTLRQTAARGDHASTFHCNIDTRRKKQSPKAIVEDLVPLQGRCGVIGNLNT